jgi:uncharacterized protein YndB with AHSA1/START domain
MFGIIIAMNQFEQTYTIKAPLQKVWEALTTAESAERWGAGPAKFILNEGGKFSYWDGDIHGINTRIISEKLLEQDWYGHDHPEEKYRAAFSFEEEGDTTVVRLTYSGHIYDEQRDIEDWREYYFDPIKKLLET